MKRIYVSFERDYRLNELQTASKEDQKVIVKRLHAINILDRHIEKLNRIKKVG